MAEGPQTNAVKCGGCKNSDGNCSRCEGKGRLPLFECPRCKGSGVDANGECGRCGGNGLIGTTECNRCGGSGICPGCKGSGWIIVPIYQEQKPTGIRT